MNNLSNVDVFIYILDTIVNMFQCNSTKYSHMCNRAVRLSWLHDCYICHFCINSMKFKADVFRCFNCKTFHRLTDGTISDDGQIFKSNLNLLDEVESSFTFVENTFVSSMCHKLMPIK